MADQSIKFSYEYGKYKYFEFSGNNNKVDVEFSWDSPKTDPSGKPMPKKVVDLFNKNVREAIQELMKTEEKTVAEIKKQIQAWDQKIEKHEIDGRNLFLFLNTINDTMEQRAADRFGGIVGGIATVMKLIVKKAFAGLDAAVRKMLEDMKWKVYAKTVGKIALALTATALAITATVLTGGAALPLVVAGAKITLDVVKEGKAAYDSFNDGADEVVALQSAVKKHRASAQEAMKAVERAESRRYLMAESVNKLERQLLAAEAKYADVERILTQKKIDGITLTADSTLLGLVNKVNRYKDLIDRLTPLLNAARADLKRLDALIDGARRAFDPSTYDAIPNADWKTILKKYADEYGGTVKTLGDLGSSIATVVQKLA
ncbi:hypothetical protein D9623_26110 (plasmid) [Azospirillum brasilense]|uniref:Uncharacterized protein n=2 Tax=Azospirillum brasilense TaxID=192 RepID=A0A4D8QQ81_AZOBR|nr:MULTISPECIES: hypothetical protein [Azospirillum]MDW7554477.1 hypothetical protein [Azospirillum brasilense]MDW7556350.1 hypothetical protein [Azospirillum brasilense]MDX5950026.1 hypothetical protein [Azospirillum brasilense]NUB11331.1 hypothetical protein [Azospirillum brasilense]NUB26185.1 hypothetical protein [Azospirillum brasilense]